MKAHLFLRKNIAQYNMFLVFVLSGLTVSIHVLKSMIQSHSTFVLIQITWTGRRPSNTYPSRTRPSISIPLLPAYHIPSYSALTHIHMHITFAHTSPCASHTHSHSLDPTETATPPQFNKDVQNLLFQPRNWKTVSGNS